MKSENNQKDLMSIHSGALTHERRRLIKRGLDDLSVAEKKERAVQPYDIPESNFVEIANIMIQNGDHLEAEKVLRKGISSMPDDWQPFADSDRLQITFWNQSEFEAFAAYQGSLGSAMRSFFWTFPSYSKAHFLLAYLAVERGNFDQALHEVNEGLVLEPDHPKMLGEKAFILRRLDRIDEALYVYQQAAISRSEWFPIASRADALRGQGFCLMDLGRLDEAETALRESLLIDPKNTAAMKALDHIEELKADGNDEDDEAPHSEAEIAVLLNNMSQHIDEVEERANNDPQWRRARANDPMYQNSTFEGRKANQVAAFEAYLREGKAGIRKHLERVRQDRISKPEPAELVITEEAEDEAKRFFYRGRGKKDDGDFSGAIEAFDRAIETDPRPARYFFHRGEAKEGNGDLKAAMADYSRAIEIDPKHSFSYHSRAGLKWMLGDLKDAFADYDKAIEILPNSPYFYNNRGRAKQANGNIEAAITDYTRAIEIDPEGVDAVYHGDIAKAYGFRGFANLKQGQFERAKEDFRKAVELDPALAGWINGERRQP